MIRGSWGKHRYTRGLVKTEGRGEGWVDEASMVKEENLSDENVLFFMTWTLIKN